MKETTAEEAKRLDDEDMEKVLTFYVNSEPKRLDPARDDPRLTLLEYLRQSIGLMGTKCGCAEGGCGACTVLVADLESTTTEPARIRYRTANSCLLPVYSLGGKQVITVEGIGDPANPHPVQERLAKGNGSQCGFCTPGIVMSLYGLLRLNRAPRLRDIEEHLDGNLCRCTGYRPILDAARTFSCESCGGTGEHLLAQFDECKPYDPDMDVPFPAALLSMRSRRLGLSVELIHLHRGDGQVRWIEPASVAELARYKVLYQNEARLVAGNTELGVDMRFKAFDCRTFINVAGLAELTDVQLLTERERCLEIGANITLSRLMDRLSELRPTLRRSEQTVASALLANLRWFASRQIRNFATLAGNIVTGSPISDLNPVLMANDATLVILTSGSQQVRQCSIRRFYLGYRQTDLRSDELLLSVRVPLGSSSTSSSSFSSVDDDDDDHRLLTRAYKQSKRRDDDIAIVNACFRLRLEPDRRTVACLDVALGGLGLTTLYSEQVRSQSVGLVWSDARTLTQIEELVLSELSHIGYGVPGGMPTYRRTLALSFLGRFWRQSLHHFGLKATKDDVTAGEEEDLENIERPISSGQQDLGGPLRPTEPYIGTSSAHFSALKHTTGTARYVDDTPTQPGELCAALVLATRAPVRIRRIEATRALAQPGVVAFYDHRNVANNVFGLGQDEELFASERCLFVGQVIGVVVAESVRLARQAARLIDVTYDEEEKQQRPILTIEEAIAAGSYFDDYANAIQSGSINSDTFNVSDDDLVFQGSCRVGGQEHFYLEPHGSLAIPKLEDDEIEVISSTQNPNECQMLVADLLGIQRNKVTVRVKRLGGGFGGKETRYAFFAAAAALAAHKLKRPVRCIADRDVDMLITGGRHPFLGKWRLRIGHDGLFKACEMALYCNAGHSLDLSGAVMNAALVVVDNAYKFPNLSIRGFLCRTNLASNTAFRAFGRPQGLLITEMMISQVAEQMGLSAETLREKNLYKPGELTHFNAVLDDWHLPEMWHRMKEESDYAKLRLEVDEFNTQHKWKKRGLAMVPAKYGLGFPIRFLNVGKALVHIHTDGSVALHHGGVEMGQGLHTKMMQVAANALRVPIELVHITETATDKVINASPTAASVSTDLNGLAVVDACEKLNERLKPYREKKPTGTLKDWATSAYLDQVDLSAIGFHKIDDIDYDWTTNTGKIYSYFTSGVAMATVELDLFTGDHTVLRLDAYMDIGKSLNPAIDIGQIEGAIVQGMGLVTIEETLVQTANGALLTRGPGNYKIPAFRDVPVQLNVKLLGGKEYTKTARHQVKSAKGVGEPPLLLGTFVLFALRDAVLSARRANGLTEPLEHFDSPCTCETLRLACGDRLVKKSLVLPRKLETDEYERFWAVRP